MHDSGVTESALAGLVPDTNGPNRQNDAINLTRFFKALLLLIQNIPDLCSFATDSSRN